MRLIVLEGSSDLINAYLPFITTSYSKTLRNSCSYFTAIPTSLFFPRAKSLLTNILEDGYVSLLVDDEDSDLIMGYSIYNIKKQKIDIVFIKRVFRGNGLFKALIPPDFLKLDSLFYTMFLNKRNLKLKKMFKELIFNPYR